jgi:gamma-glutamylputrescine oxidase
MKSPWENELSDLRPHLAVVGAGIVGLFTALHYKRAHPGHRVLVLERGPYPFGASVRNAGFACFGSPSELLADAATEGAEAMLERVEERWKGLLALRAELGDERIGYEATGGYEIYGPGSPHYARAAEGLEELNMQLRDIIGQNVYRWHGEAVERFGLGRTANVAYTPYEGALNSGKLMRTLLQQAETSGVAVHFNAEVLAQNNGAEPGMLALGKGGRLRAGQVVFATNGYTQELLGQVDIVPARGQVLLTEPVPGLALRGTFHAHEGYYYFRDHAGGVLLGGGRHLDVAGETTNKEGLTDLVQNDLERMLREVVLPGKSVQIAQRWSGIMGFRRQGKTPLVQRLNERTIVAAGLSGMGVAIGIRVAARAAALAGM